MNEIVLMAVIIIVLFTGSYLINKMKKPGSYYIKIFSGFFLLVLYWVFANETELPLKVIMTVIILSAISKSLIEYREYKKVIKPGKPGSI